LTVYFSECEICVGFLKTQADVQYMQDVDFTVFEVWTK